MLPDGSVPESLIRSSRERDPGINLNLRKLHLSFRDKRIRRERAETRWLSRSRRSLSTNRRTKGETRWGRIEREIKEDNSLNSQYNRDQADGSDLRVFYVALDETIVERASSVKQ